MQESAKVVRKLNLPSNVVYSAEQALAQQRKMLKGVVNPKLQETIRQLFKVSDKMPGGTAGAVFNERVTGLPTGGLFHTDKALNRIGNLNNILKKETLLPLEKKKISKLISSLSRSINPSKNK